MEIWWIAGSFHVLKIFQEFFKYGRIHVYQTTNFQRCFFLVKVKLVENIQKLVSHVFRGLVLQRLQQLGFSCCKYRNQQMIRIENNGNTIMIPEAPARLRPDGEIMPEACSRKAGLKKFVYL